MKTLKGGNDSISNCPPPTDNSIELYSLSAEILAEDSDNYECVRRINEQINKEGIYNIAVTGAYGAGKTTILKTLENKFPNNYLNISLANFKITEYEGDNPKKLMPEEEDELNRLLEYSIIQQLIYHEDQKALPESRFRRIKNIQPKTVTKITLGIILFFACVFVIFQPAFVKNTSIYNFLQVPLLAKFIIDIFFGGLAIVLLYQFISSLIKAWGNSKLNKINLKDGEIGFCNDDTNSILNKHLDEVLYYFEKTNYNVVIIEDLDRFRTPLIFSKLREINTLINYYKPIQENPDRKIVFIYAIRDDLFIDNTLRTKFFDVIIPVIPIVDPSNAGSKLKKLLGDKAKSDANQIDDSTYRDLGHFIAEMRLLKTIVNDYLVYRKILSDQLQPANLLAMMAYKNFYPQDFIALSHQQGILSEILNNKSQFAEIIKNKIDIKIKEYKQQISDIEKEKYKSLDELKDLYLYRLTHHHRDFRRFIDPNGNKKSLSDMHDEALFRCLISGEITQYECDSSYSRTISPTFSSIETEIDPNHKYLERAELWSKKENNEIHNLSLKIQQLEGEKLELPYRPIAELFVAGIESEINDYVHSINKDKLDVRLLLFVLQKGLIDSNYYDYISFFHEGLISSSDNEFLMNVNSRRHTEFTHTLNNHKTLIEEIPLPLFKESFILNFSLLNFLCKNTQIYTAQLACIFEQLKENEKSKIEFFKKFTSTNEAAGQFLKLFSQHWTDLWLYIEEHFAADLNTYSYLMIKHLSERELNNINKNKHFKSYLEKNFDLFGVWETQIHTEVLVKIISELAIKFDSIDSTKVSEKLFQYIEFQKYYKITDDNITAILKFYEKTGLIEKLNIAHYSTVIESNIPSLVSYIQENIQYYTTAVLNAKKTSKEETELTLIKFINDEELPYSPKREYLLNQNGWIENIEDIDEDFWHLAIDSLIIFPDWDNVIRYYKKHVADYPGEPLSDSFKEYLSNEAVYSKLNNNKVSTEVDDSASITSLFNEISLDKEFDDTCYIKLLEAFDENLMEDSIEGFSDTKINYLVHSGQMPFSEYHLGQLKDYFSQFVSAYLIIHKEEYIEGLEYIYINSKQYSELLSSGEFSNEESTKIVESISINELDEDPHLATLMCRAIINSGFGINEEILKEIIQLCQDEQLKVEVVYSYLTTVIYDEDIVSEYLNLLPEDYQKITIESKKPRISINSHRDLLEYLKNKGYLKNVIPHDKHITVVTRD